MTELSDVLRKVGREKLGIVDGEYFDSTFFDVQAEAVRVYIKELVKESEGDVDYILWKMKK